MESSDPPLPDFAEELRGHIDRYKPDDTFVCIFCAYESNNPVECLEHLVQKHDLLLSNIRHIPLIPNYLQYWRIHTPPLINYQRHQTIEPDNPEEISVRQSLHKMRLENIMREHEQERTLIQKDIPCLFCSEEPFTGTWHDYLQFLFKQHQFNPGRPANLIFIPELINLLHGQLENFICIFCGSQFPNQRTLRSHMRKKKHMRIPNDPSFDRYYMVNYLELDGSWQGEEIDDEDNEPLEIAAQDFNDTEVNETLCLICESTFMNPEEVIRHMRQVHNFDINEIRNVLQNDFYNCVRFINFARYEKSKNHCFICEQYIADNYSDHIESHENKIPGQISKIFREDQLLIPFIDGDPLLTELEADVD